MRTAVTFVQFVCFVRFEYELELPSKYQEVRHVRNKLPAASVPDGR